MNIEHLNKLLNDCWSYETCSPGLKGVWNNENPAIGQCAITALIVNDFFGGKIMRCMSISGSHYYNLIDEKIVDLTVNQFLGILPLYEEGEERTRDYLANNKDTRDRYLLLLDTLKNKINLSTNKRYKLIDSSGKTYESDIAGTFGGNKKLKIYGRLDCPSAKKWIEKGYYIKNRVFFENEETAILAGYRPCARCMPEEYKKWKKIKIK